MNPRALRFLSTFNYFLTSVFVSTILFDVYYPASICSDLNGNLNGCVGLSTRLPFGESLCSYETFSGQCMLRSPPRTVSFLMILALITSVIMIPYSVFFYAMLRMVCEKRPRLGDFGHRFAAFIGDESDDFGELISEAETDARAERVQESLERLLTSERSQNQGKEILYALQKLGLSATRSGQLELSILSRFRFRSVNACIKYHIHQSYLKASQILRTMKSLPNTSQRNPYLIQHFAMERFSAIFRVSLFRNYGHSACDLPQTVHPVAWILGWLFVMASMLFFIVWIIKWGFSYERNAIIVDWGINILLSNLYDVLFFSIIRIMVVNIVLVRAIRPELNSIKLYLENLQKRSRRSDGVLQLLEPSLIAAEISGISELGRVSDADLYGFHDGRHEEVCNLKEKNESPYREEHFAM